MSNAAPTVSNKLVIIEGFMSLCDLHVTLGHPNACASDERDGHRGEAPVTVPPDGPDPQTPSAQVAYK